MADIDIYKVVSHYEEPVANKVCCPFHNEKTPSLHLFEGSNSFFCFGCSAGGDAISFVMKKEEVSFKEALGKVSEIIGENASDYVGKDKVSQERPQKPSANPMPVEAIREFQKGKVIQNINHRGIREETDSFFRHLSEMDANGKVSARYYPETLDGKLMGYKARNSPKDFSYGKVGKTGNSNDLSGQHLFKSGGKYILITGGEEDKAAAYQMFADKAGVRVETVHKGDNYNITPVVSPTAGEGSAANQCAANYDFLDSFDNIIIGMDNDTAGIKAAEEIAKVLPKEKVRIAKWSKKDPNAMLEAGMIKQFVSDFWNAKEVVNSGITSSSTIMGDVKEVLTAQKISLPKYMKVMESNMKRAFSRNGRIVNIIGSTSCGKTTHVNNMIYHWIFSEGLKPLILSLEMTAGEYAVDLLSLHLKKNLDWFEEGMDAWNYLEREDVKILREDLFTDEHGEERFKIIDERDGSVESVVSLVERGVKQYGCNIVIIDVLTDLIRFLPNEGQERHMSWQKNFVKGGTSIVNILHTRKLERNKEGVLQKATEFDALGSSTQVQSAHINIVINRDKMAEDLLERNSTYVDMPKCRRGTTGPAGVWIYDGGTRQVYDQEDYRAGKTSTTVEGEYEEVPPNVSGEEIDINDII